MGAGGFWADRFWACGLRTERGFEGLGGFGLVTNVGEDVVLVDDVDVEVVGVLFLTYGAVDEVDDVDRFLFLTVW